MAQLIQLINLKFRAFPEQAQIKEKLETCIMLFNLLPDPVNHSATLQVYLVTSGRGTN